MAFGFVIERFGLFVQIIMPKALSANEKVFSFWVGIAFVLLGALVSYASTRQYYVVLKSLKPIEIPDGYRTSNGVFTNLAVSALGVALAAYLFMAQ